MQAVLIRSCLATQQNCGGSFFFWLFFFRAVQHQDMPQFSDRALVARSTHMERKSATFHPLQFHEDIGEIFLGFADFLQMKNATIDQHFVLRK